MNAKKLFSIAAVFVASGSVFAQPNTEFVEFNDFVSTKSRAEVRAELVEAQASGEWARSAEFVDAAPAASTLSRAAVRADLEKAYYAGDLNRNMEWEEPARIASTRTREEVRNEVLQAGKTRRAGSDS